MKTARKIFWTN